MLRIAAMLLLYTPFCVHAASKPVHMSAQWQTVRDGVTYLYQKSPDNKLHVVKVDLQHPKVSFQATTPQQIARTTSQFAVATGALVAVNGDFFRADYSPVGLAMGKGTHWEGSEDNDRSTFLACSATYKRCAFDFSGGTIDRHPEWTDVVGGIGVLVQNGQARTQEDDQTCGSLCSTKHPRTAVGMSEDKRFLYLIVLEGRQPDAKGMSLNALAQTLLQLGIPHAINLDGGGSSVLFLDGRRVTGRPSNEPKERVVANHFGILYKESP